MAEAAARARDAEVHQVQRQDRRERAADEVDEEQHDQQRDDARHGRDGAEGRARSSRAGLGGTALDVEREHEHERERAQRGGQQERAPDPDRVGQQAAGQRADRGRQDLRGLDQADGAPGVLASSLGGRHREPQRADAPEEADADPEQQQLPDVSSPRPTGPGSPRRQTRAFVTTVL